MVEKHTVKDLFGIHAGAVFDGQYRYDLFRIWDDRLPIILFVMLNPSTADERKLDPTVTRCRNFAVSWGFGSLHVVNVFALISTDPKALEKADDPVGPLNGQYISRLAEQASRVIVAWGTNRLARKRQARVLPLLHKHHKEVFCLGFTRGGFPRHPLYVPRNTELVVFNKEGERNARRNAKDNRRVRARG